MLVIQNMVVKGENANDEISPLVTSFPKLSAADSSKCAWHMMEVDKLDNPFLHTRNLQQTTLNTYSNKFGNSL